ncbi:MAG: arsenate reductase family protein [candidate division Zixibacteria bacterium]|nr:arsenate reductase family protein [candidate division Zixibacteria bacterium]
MIVQIFGTKKCKESRKAERFFKERRIGIQVIDIRQKEISPGEFKSICNSVAPEDLINTEGREYEKRGFKYMKFSIIEELLENPLLFKTPIVRYKGKATVGYQPDIWKTWVE